MSDVPSQTAPPDALMAVDTQHESVHSAVGLMLGANDPGITSSATSPSTPALSDLPFASLRQQLIESSHYLGDPSFNLKDFCWRSSKSGQILTSKSTVAENKRSLDAYNDYMASSSASPDDADDTLAPTVVPITPAVFTAVGFIDPNGFFAAPCGNWNGPSKYTSKFEDVKLSFLLVTPVTVKTFRGDFHIACKNLRDMCCADTDPNVEKRGVVYSLPPDIANGIRLRHKFIAVSPSFHNTFLHIDSISFIGIGTPK